jgi:protein-tyrosine-phosphatase/predicted ATP-grasp superfamily ATP-dependent carboligase
VTPLSGRVLILGEDTRSFLSTVRSLGRAGLEVHVAWCPFTAPALRSRYIHKLHRLPAYQATDDAWLRALIHLLQAGKFDLVIPCHDSSLVPLHHHRSSLEPYARLALPDPQSFELSFSKRKAYELGQTLGVPVPPQREVRSIAELHAAAEEFGFPLVVKPEASVSTANPFYRRMVTKVFRMEDLDQVAKTLPFSQGVLVQQNFIGIGVGVEVLCRDGEILTAFQHERVHEPLMGGGSSYRRSVPLDPAMLGAARTLMSALNYTGVCMVEFKLNRDTGKWVLIEINNRFWGSLPLTIAAGLDIPRYLYEMLCRGRSDFPQQYRTNRYARNWVMDLYWLSANFKNKSTDPTLLTLDGWTVAWEVFHILGLRETSDTWAFDDPFPAIHEMAQLAGQRFGRRSRRWTLVQRSFRRAAQIAMRTGHKILFVCKGNICRSPFAELAARQMIGAGKEFRSAGHYPVPGRRSPKNALDAARSFTVDLSTHQSVVLTEELIDWADTIFVFDAENRAFFEDHFPNALPKVHYFGGLGRSTPVEVVDPFGGSIDDFLGVYRMIQKALTDPAVP